MNCLCFDPQVLLIHKCCRYVLCLNERMSLNSFSISPIKHLKIPVNSEANARRIAMVESCFGGSGQPLSIPGRVLVGEGVLTKMCRKRPKPRQFFLFNDILVYGNIVIGKKKYNKQHIIPLEDVKLQTLEDNAREFIFEYVNLLDYSHNFR